VEAMLNYLSLLGWDYYSALESLNTVSDLPTPSVGPGSEILPAHARKDTHSLYEVFTVPQLISAFDLTHITRRKAAVSQSKLDFLNKMTLRRKAGRMGRDSETAELGKERLGRSEESLGEARNELIEKLQGMLRDVRTLKDW
jgi:glutamyl-tRNA synthetase